MNAWLKPVVVLTLLALALWSHDFLLCLKSQVDFLSVGFSTGKTLLLLAFLALLFSTERLPSPWRPSWNVAFFVGVGLLHVIALLERFLFVRATGSSWSGWQAAVSDGRYSSTRLAHLHEPKACIAWLTRYVGGDFDSGFTFLPYFPNSLLAAQALLLLGTTLVAYLVVHDYQRRASNAKSLALAVSMFVFLKTAVDGGPFSTEVALPLFFLLGLLYGAPGARIGAGIGLVLLPFSIWLASGSLALSLTKLLGAAMLLSAPFVWEQTHHLARRKRLLIVFAWLSIPVAIPFFQYATIPIVGRPPFTAGVIVYRNTPLHPPLQLSVYSLRELGNLEDVPLHLLQVTKGQNYFCYRAQVSESTTAGELCDRLRLNSSWQPILWFDKPVYFEFVGKFPRPLPQDWPTHPLLVRYKVEEQKEQAKISFELKPGSLVNTAFDSLPAGNYVVTRYTYSDNPPNFDGYQNGPGWSEPHNHPESR